MMKTKLALCALAVAGLLGSTFAADAKTKHPSKHSSMTTGANMKSGTTGMSRGSSMSRGGSSEGNVGPGTNNNSGPNPGGR
jgi:hypothetical protein